MLMVETAKLIGISSSGVAEIVQKVVSTVGYEYRALSFFHYCTAHTVMKFQKPGKRPIQNDIPISIT